MAGQGRDPYVVLGIPPDADFGQIKRAYRRLVLMLHPDLARDKASGERLREVQQAFEALGELPRRDEPSQRQPAPEPQPVPIEPVPVPYSQWRHAVRFEPEPYYSSEARQVASQSRSLSALVDEMLDGFVPEVLPERPPGSAKDLVVEVVLTRAEAAAGGTFPLVVPLRRRCEPCLGSGLESFLDACRHCHGRGFQTDKRELELVVPPQVQDGQQTSLALTDDPQGPRLHIAIRLV